MVWYRLKCNKLPSSEVLAVDEQQKYLIGLVFEDSNSSTGYICHSVDDEEIECVAYQEIATGEQLHDVEKSPPYKHKVVVAILDSGEAVIGHVYKDENTGLYTVRNDIGDYVGVQYWYIPNKFKHKAKIVFVNYFGSLVAMFTLGFLLQGIIQTYLDVSSMFGSFKKYDALIYELEHLSMDITQTDNLKQHLGDSGDTDVIEFSYNGKKYSENLNMDNLYIDSEGYWHYLCEDGTAYIMSEQGSYLIDRSKRRYQALNECTVGFYNVNFPGDMFDARRIDESSDTIGITALPSRGELFLFSFT